MSEKEIVIFGAGDLAREVAFLIRELNRRTEGWNLLGFVVEDRDLFGKKVCGYPIIEGVQALRRERYGGAAAIGVGIPAIAYRITDQIRVARLNMTFPVLIHPSVIADWDNLMLGQGVIVCAGCVLTTQISLGDFTFVNLGCTIAHDVKTGVHSIINPQASISGGVTLDDYVYIGSNAVIMEDKHIGKGAQVSIGAVVSTDVEPWTVVGGNPARVIRRLEPWGRGHT